MPDDGEEAELQKYWDAIELQDDLHLGFGALRGLKKKVRQKGVDALLAVDVLEGAFSGLFDIAILVTGDGDFTPVVEAARRRGVMVAVAAVPSSLSDELRRAADRFIELQKSSKWIRPMVL